jgi:hypothetical protein
MKLNEYYERRKTTHSTHWNYQKVKEHIFSSLFYIRHQTVPIKSAMASVPHTIR